MSFPRYVPMVRGTATSQETRSSQVHAFAQQHKPYRDTHSKGAHADFPYSDNLDKVVMPFFNFRPEWSGFPSGPASWEWQQGT
eukprot:1158381-Pelagomonas_calceolata.AAC.3